MSNARETVLIAQDLYERMGAGGIELADGRAQSLRGAGDMGGSQFWRDVSHAMVLIATRPNSILRLSSAGSESPIWSLMQRVEGYRHLASEAEDVASAVSATSTEMERIAKGWRELAATLEVLASQLPEVRAPEAFRGSLYELN
jgi:hypothetical protein